MKTAHTVLFVAVLSMATGSPALAMPRTSVTTSAWGGSNINSPSPSSDSEHLLSNSGAPLTSNSSLVASDALWFLSASSSAHVRPGLIQLTASSTASTHDNGPPFYVSATAKTDSTANWTDSFTIDGGALNGQVGHLVAGFRVDGTLTSIFDSSVNFAADMKVEYRARIRLTNGAGTGQDVFEKGGQRHIVDFRGDRWVATDDMPYRNPGLWTVSIDFKFGTPIQIDMWGDILALADAYACDSCGYGYSDSNITATVDFGHTMNWAGIIGLTDSLGNPVNSFAISSVSGFDYRQAAAVPEPAIPLMMLAGLGLVGLQWRRKARLAMRCPGACSIFASILSEKASEPR